METRDQETVAFLNSYILFATGREYDDSATLDGYCLLSNNARFVGKCGGN